MRLLCKQSYSVHLFGVTINKGQHYELDDNLFTMTLASTSGMLHFWKTTTNYIQYDQPYLWYYFYTPQEERKLKLEKIETISNR